jgi:pilus assembly protein CpaE
MSDSKPQLTGPVDGAQQPDNRRQQAWPWGIGLVARQGDLATEITAALREMNAACELLVAPSVPPFELAAMVEKYRPKVLFVELAAVGIPAQEWITLVRAGSDTPVIIAIHANEDPAEMITAMRAGATEFLSLPVRPALFELLDRVATLLEARQVSTGEPGKLVGILSAKGGCGATTLACHLSCGLQLAGGGGRVLMADLDHQAPAAHRIFGMAEYQGIQEAFDSVRRLNSACWPEFVRSVGTGSMVDILGASLPGAAPVGGHTEPWRIESLFRFLRRHYSWIVADLGRHLNPSNWAYFAHLDALLVVTAPDVLALYQTRSILQMLTNRGFEKSRVRLILNRNQDSPQDFWIESIEQMFDMSVLAVLPHDAPTLSHAAAEKFEFPATSGYGRSVTKLAGRILHPGGPDSAKKRAA